MRALGAILPALLMTAAPAFPQSAEPGAVREPIDYETARLSRVVRAVRITQPITVDGRLDEPEWDLGVPAENFTQRVPDTEQPESEITRAWFLYDDENLYVGVRSLDSDAGNLVVNDLTEDYNFRSSDAVSIIIDSLRDFRSGFLFTTNPAGARADYQIIDGAFNVDWDGVWDVDVSRNADGWVAEFRIPFKTLRFSMAESQVWGVNVSRRILRRSEETYWAPIPFRYTISRVQLNGTLEGLEGIRPGRNLKIKPFVTGGFTESRRPGAVSRLDADTEFDGGVDVKYSLTPSLTLDATYRTDFAQVEVDQQQVNLTRFNLFFPEKREFFLENQGIFAFGQGTNSFGQGGNLVPFFSRRIGLSGNGTPVPIVGGARVTGKVGRYDIGVLNMQTASHDGAPSNNYVVGRVKRNLLTNSWIGALVTNRDSAVAGDYNRVYGPDAHFQFFERLEFDSFLLISDTPGQEGRNQARQFQTAWRDDELTIVGAYNAIETNFNPEMGFVRRDDNTHYNGEFAWHPILEDHPLVQRLNFGTRYDYYKNGTTQEIETRSTTFTTGIVFRNTSTVDFTVTDTFDRLLEPFAIRRTRPAADGTVAREAVTLARGDYRYLDYDVSFSTDPSRKISGSGSLNWGEFWDGRRTSAGGSLAWKPNFHMNIDIGYEHNRVHLPQAEFTTDLLATRFTYAFTSRAFLNAFVQYNVDTHQVSSNIRFHLIHRPLSDLYIVYNDLRDTQGTGLVERALIVKFTNLFDF